MEFGYCGDHVSPVKFSDCLLMGSQVTVWPTDHILSITTLYTTELSFHICAFAQLDSNNLDVKMGNHTCFESVKSYYLHLFLQSNDYLHSVHIVLGFVV